MKKLKVSLKSTLTKIFNLNIPNRIVQGKTYKLHGKVDQKQRTKTYLDFKKAEEGT